MSFVVPLHHRLLCAAPQMPLAPVAPSPMDMLIKAQSEQERACKTVTLSLLAGMCKTRHAALQGRPAPSACNTCAVLLFVRRSSWCRLRSSTAALMAATASTKSSDSVGPYGANGLTTAHHARLACACWGNM